MQSTPLLPTLRKELPAPCTRVEAIVIVRPLLCPTFGPGTPDPPAEFRRFFRLEEDLGADEETQDHFARNQAENQCKTNRDAGKEPIATRHLTPARRSPTLKEKQPESRHDDLDDEDRLLPHNQFV